MSLQTVSEYVIASIKKIFFLFNADDQMAGGNMRPHELQRNVKRAQMVDRASRIMFPFLFLVFNTVYWTFYLFRGDSSQ